MNQSALILGHLKKGWHSGLMLFQRTGAIDYRARISELRRNWVVEDRWTETHGKRYKLYRVTGRL